MRLNSTGAEEIRNLEGSLTTVVGRVCLDMLRSREARREEALDAEVVEPGGVNERVPDPEEEAVLADSVELALLGAALDPVPTMIAGKTKCATTTKR